MTLEKAQIINGSSSYDEIMQIKNNIICSIHEGFIKTDKVKLLEYIDWDDPKYQSLLYKEDWTKDYLVKRLLQPNDDIIYYTNLHEWIRRLLRQGHETILYPIDLLLFGDEGIELVSQLMDSVDLLS